jgi:hypothetical protein
MSLSVPVPRNQLPGLNLPLNWTPHAAFINNGNEYSDYPMEAEVPAQGDGRELFRTALSDAGVMDGKTS